MGGFGQEVIGTFKFGSSVRASNNPEGMRGGTIDWGLIPAATENTSFNDGREVKVGEKCLRYGTVLVRITAEVPSKNMFALYDRNATDGRQQLGRGDSYILDETICESDSHSNPRLFDGGSAWKARLLVGGNNQPSWDEFYATFPRVSLIAD